MYGVPVAEYKLSGTVVDTTTNAAIPGISLTFNGTTATSAADGTWSLDVHGFPCANTCALAAKDVDGTENGSYADLQVPLAPTQTTPGHGAFDQGVFEQKDIKVSLQHPSL